MGEEPVRRTLWEWNIFHAPEDIEKYMDKILELADDSLQELGFSEKMVSFLKNPNFPREDIQQRVEERYKYYASASGDQERKVVMLGVLKFILEPLVKEKG